MTTPNAAREQDEIIHSSIWADVVSIVAEGVVYAAAGVVVAGAALVATPFLTAFGAAGAAAAAATTAIGSSCVMSGFIGSMIIQASDLGDSISSACADFGNWLFPPSAAGTISTGSKNVHTNGKPAARAAGRLLSKTEIAALPSPPEEHSFLDYASSLLNTAKSFVSEMIQPTVDAPSGPTAEAEHDRIDCSKHSPIQYMAEGSDKVSINDLPAVRANDRSTCEGKVSEAVSPNVLIGGGTVVVRPIKSGKLPGLEFIYMAASLLRGKPKAIFKSLPCMLAMGAIGMGVNRISNAIQSLFNPVHAATGAKILSGEEELDFSLPARYPLFWQRIYNSRNHARGLFGQGWLTPFEVSVTREANHYCYRDMSGRELRFEPPVPGIQYFNADEGLIIAANERGDLTISDSDGECWRLFTPRDDNPAHLRLVSLSDEYGNGLILHYDAQHRLHQITDTAQTLAVTLVYHHPDLPHCVTHIVEQQDNEPDRDLVHYRYNDQGQVSAVIDASGVIIREYAYNEHNLLTQHRLPEGLRCDYDWAKFDDWRVVEYKTNAGEHCRIDYDMVARTTHVIHANQLSHTHEWNEQFLVTRYTDEAGNDWWYEWNELGLLSQTSSPLNEQWHFHYDENGCLTEETDPLGNTTLIQWLTTRDLIKSITSPDGSRTLFSYDVHHGLISETNALGQTTTFERDEFGEVIKQIDAKQGVRQLTYNLRGQITRHQDCSGKVTQYRYNAQHQLICTEDAEHEETHFHYDAAGRPLVITRPDGWSNRFYWDALGRLSRFEQADGSCYEYHWYDSGLLQRTVNPQQGTVERQYDERGRLVALRNENHEQYRFRWGPDDVLCDEIGLDGVVTHYEYDACGRTIQRTFAFGTDHALVHHARYNALGQLVQRQTDEGLTHYEYTLGGQLASARFTSTGEASYSQFVHFTYDKLGQLIQEHTLSGRVDYQYDVLGNRTQVGLPNGKQLKTLYYGSGHALQINLDETVITEFTRDNLHREVTRTQGHIRSQRQYDRLGRLARQTRYHSQQGTKPLTETRWDYDLRHNLVVTQEETTPYGWKNYQYDTNDQLLHRRSDRYSPETYYYDAAANLLQDAHAPACLHNRVTHYHGYTYRYDEFGRTIEKSSAGERWSYRYNSDHQLIEVLHTTHHPYEQRCQVQFSYDPLGRRLHKQVTYLPNPHVPLALQHRPTQAHPCGTTTFLWEGLRLLSEQRHGIEMLYVYEDADSYAPLARVDSVGEQRNIFYFQCQPNGLPDALYDVEGQLQWHARFTSWGKTEIELGNLHSNGYARSQNLRFQGQYFDRETGLHYNTFRYYDPDIGRFTQQDPIGLAGGLNLYQYAP
ncbi:RHS repeat-associated core domain-containing protein, partial [Providencia stuartii]|uniref:RHS repeat-associated core domain-containing protein n=1 Tax=Providencia stuartii TaxID=588 RepID=UPI000C9C15C7